MRVGTTTLLAVSIWGSAAFAKSPVEVVKGLSALAPVKAERVLYRDGDTTVLRTADATSEDFQGVYVLNMSLEKKMPAKIAALGDVLAFEPNRIAVMKVHADSIDEVAGRLHSSGLACGVLLKLDGRPLAEVAATPVPIIPIAQRDARVQRVTEQVLAQSIATTINELSAINTRFHNTTTGIGVAEVLAQKYDALKGDRTDVTITTYDHGSATPQRSLVVKIQGTTRPTEVIVLGSHLDSVNWQDGSSARAPGSDDNASGTATNLEIFRLLMANDIHLERSLEIHAYAAEEIGLVGSQDIANDYKAAGVNVVAMVQHDMDLWKADGSADKIWFVNNNTDSAFNDMLGQLVDGYAGMPWAKANLSGGSSDHASWRRAGYATSFPFENPTAYNHKIHSANDNVANASAFTQAAGFAKLGLAYVMHFGGLN